MDKKNILEQKLRHLFLTTLPDDLFHLNIPFLLVKYLMKFDTLDDGCCLPTVYLAMTEMF